MFFFFAFRFLLIYSVSLILINLNDFAQSECNRYCRRKNEKKKKTN